MKLSQNQDNIATINNTVGEISSFKVKNSAKAFSILSSGIYANKIKAIIRELSCNAYDSHVEAGKKDIPFEVHIPTYFEPYFYVRDYGTGLTHQQVFDVYTTYFESTKTNSNDYIGALGLGSKSPFSYTENFTITAIRDGRKGVYSAFINDDGYPSVVLMADEKTDEPNGVEVRFAVENYSDFMKFSNEAKNVFHHFQLKPTITGNQDIEIPEKEYVYENISENIHILKVSRFNSMNSYAIMGNICYPIDINSIENHIDNSYLLEYLRHSVEFHFDIGEVEFQTSREGLSYTSKTIKAIETKLIELDNNLYKKVKESLDHYNNVWEKTQKIYDLLKSNYIFRTPIKKYVNNYFNKINNNSKYITDPTASMKYSVVINSEILEEFNIKIRGFGEKYGGKCNNYFTGSFSEFDTKSGTIGFPISTRTIFVTNEKKTGAIARAKYNFNIDNADTLFVIEKGEDDKEPDFEGFFKYIFNPSKEQIFNVNELEKKPSSRKKSSSPRSTLSINFNRRYNYSYTEPEYIWEETYVDFDDNTTKHFYIPLSGYDPICDDKSKRIDDIKGFYSFMNKQKLFNKVGFDNDIKIYGVRKKDIDLVKDKDNWIDIQEHMASLSPVLVEDIYYGYLLSMQENEHINYMMSIKDEIIEYIKDENSYFKKIMDTIKKYKNEQSLKNPDHKLNFEKYLFVDYHLGENQKNNLKQKVEDIRLTLCEKYPMMFHIDTSWCNRKQKEKVIKDIADYINIMDNDYDDDDDKIKGEK